MMKKSILLVIFAAICFGCTSGDESGPMITVDNDPIGMEDDSDEDENDEENMVNLNLNGVTNLDFSALTAVSSENTAQIDDVGNFENIMDIEEPDLPIIFTNEGQVIMGYFPEALSSEEITVDDIVYFFFKTFPVLAVQNFEDTTLRDLLINSSQYPDMVALVTNALNENISVTNNPEFDELVREIIKDDNLSAQGKSNKVEPQFRFEYSRLGTIGIPNNVPLFSYLGAEIRDVSTNQLVFGPKLLETESLVLSPRSLFDFIADELFLDSEPLSEEFTLLNEGQYEIKFTNGNINNSGLANDVIIQNYKYFALTTLGYAVPFGLKKLLKNENCNSEIVQLLAVPQAFIGDIVQSNSPISTPQVIEFIRSLGSQALTLSTCFAQDNGSFTSTFLPSITDFLNKRLSIAEDIAELTFFVRDFLGSEISGVETRYFQEGVSVGFLTQTGISDTSFEGITEDVLIFQALFEETVVSYDVDRTLTESRFLRSEDIQPAAELPFTATITSGDVAISPNNPILTDGSGTLVFDMTLGDEDSEITVMPEFSSPDVTDITINVNVENNPLIGKWQTRFIPVTTDTFFDEFTTDDCEGVVFNLFKILSEQFILIFNEDGTVILEAKAMVNRLNQGATVQNCEETFNGTVEEIAFESATGEYTVENNELIVSGVDGFTAIWTLNIINDELITISIPTSSDIELWLGTEELERQ